jgi:hypothetical protein
VKIKHFSILSATAVALLSLIGAAQAGSSGGLCSNATLKGPYGFTGHGEILGLIGPDGSVHKYASSLILDDIALVTFDGAGHFSRTDFGVIAGLPKGGQTTFNPYQSGTYTVNSDCTGTMQIIYTAGGPTPAGVEVDLEIIVADDGTLIESIASKGITASGATPDGITCPPYCKQAAQERFEGKRSWSSASASRVPDGFTFARPRRTRMPDDSGIDERQEIRVDRIGLRGGHAVWEAFVGFQGAVLQQFRAQRPRVGIRYDLIVVAVHH